MYKKLMPIFAVMISTQAFADEFPSGFHPFDDHLYGGEGAELYNLKNGKYYTQASDPVVPIPVYSVTERNGSPFEFVDYSSNSITIDDEAWNITWVDNGGELPAGQDPYPIATGGLRDAFLSINCTGMGVDEVVIDNVHITNVMTSRYSIVPYRTIAIANCHSVIIQNSSFTGPVAQAHIQINNSDHIYINNVEISGTLDPSGSGEYYLGGGIAIHGGDQNTDVGEGIHSTIIKNTYIHNFTEPSPDMLAKKEKVEAWPNHDAVGMRSPGTGIFFNNYIENFHGDSGLDIGHSRGDDLAINGDASYEGYFNKTFKVERNIFDDVRRNKLTGKFGEEQGNQLLFSNNIYFNTHWRAYFCNTEVVFAFESYYFNRNFDENPDYSLLTYEGCPRNGARDKYGNQIYDDNGDPILNTYAHLMPIKRYNTHYYFAENVQNPNEVRVRPTAFNYLKATEINNYEGLIYVAGAWHEYLTEPEWLIQGDHNRYSFNVDFNHYIWGDTCNEEDGITPRNSNAACKVKPTLWIDSPHSDLLVTESGVFDALFRYQQLGQGIDSELVENESVVCYFPMLNARTDVPVYKSINNTYCSDLKVAASQSPLIGNGFGYTTFPVYTDDYKLFRRDFYGNTRFGSQVTVGAIK